MIKESDLKSGAVFYSEKFDERYRIDRVTPKMVWRQRKPAPGEFDLDKRLSKEDCLCYLNACGFKFSHLDYHS